MIATNQKVAEQREDPDVVWLCFVRFAEGSDGSVMVVTDLLVGQHDGNGGKRRMAIEEFLQQGNCSFAVRLPYQEPSQLLNRVGIVRAVGDFVAKVLLCIVGIVLHLGDIAIVAPEPGLLGVDLLRLVEFLQGSCVIALVFELGGFRDQSGGLGVVLSRPGRMGTGAV